MTVTRLGRALDLCDVRQGGDVSPSPRCTAAPRHCRRDRRGRRRAGGWPKTRRLHRSLILGLAPLTSFVVDDIKAVEKLGAELVTHYRTYIFRYLFARRYLGSGCLAYPHSFR